MNYAVKELFFTLQGEGINAGRPAVFLRFTGCNLWSGREADRHRGMGGCALWCDTDFVGTDGPGGGRFATPDALADAVTAQWPIGTGANAQDKRFVVCTGGEPLLQLDAPLIDALHARRFEIAVETNGTQAPPHGLDWVCVSPKARAELRLTQGDELKLVFPQEGMEPEKFSHLPFRHFLLQPMDGPQLEKNTRAALQYCLTHPQWRLSLQTHKLLRIP
jgi:7-carboxy-7-deazaguanine synthase (Cx14CxxC type)